MYTPFGAARALFQGPCPRGRAKLEGPALWVRIGDCRREKDAPRKDRPAAGKTITERAMSYLEQKQFFFESGAPGVAKDTFSVVRFEGTEAMSSIYRFEITLVSKEPDVDLDDVLANPATLHLRAGRELPVHGALASFDQLNEVDGNYFYKAVLVPRLWRLTLYRISEVYLDMTVPEIIEQVLKECGLKSMDYELKLTREYEPWEYVCQYQETHFNFLSRWMEREGIFYYFEQGDAADKLIVTDTYLSHTDLPDETTIHYSPVSGLEVDMQKEACTAFICRQKPIPAKVVLQDFNYRKSPHTIQGEAEVHENGVGEVYLYAEHLKTSEEAELYAGIRAEEILCRRKLFHADTNVTFLRVGFFFELDRHYRDDYNRKFLLLSVRHEGNQASLLAGGVDRALSEADRKPFYMNSIEAIPDDVQFRPERTAEKTRFHGSINAVVEAEGDGQYAEIDEFGRYKIKLPFDRSDRAGQKASRWVRMAQPHAGPEEGMHFPLRKGTEVLLTFVDGDPDRPIISGAVPNIETGSPVKDENLTQDMIRTHGQNKITFENKAGSERILMQSPTANSWFRVGAHNDPPPAEKVEDKMTGDGIRIQTSDDFWTEAQGRYGEYTIGAPARNDTPQELRYLRDKFYKSGGDFRPTGMQAYSYSGGTDPLANWNGSSWSYLVNRGHLRMIKGDTFITQEGNIYDFGGYWNYNLGNSYVETHMSQKATLNERRTLGDINSKGGTIHPDKLSPGGPSWTSIEDNEISDKGSWDNGDVWVEKQYGNSYQYTEGSTIEVLVGSSQSVKYGGAKHVEQSYTSKGFKCFHSESEGGVTQEWKWDGITEIPIGYSYKCYWLATGNTFKFEYTLASKQEVSVDIGLTIAVKVNLNNPVSISLQLNPLTVDLKIGAAFGFDFDLRVGGVVKLDNSNKLTFDGMGFTGRKEALAKAEKAEARLKAITADIKDLKFDMRAQKIKMAAHTLEFAQFQAALFET